MLGSADNYDVQERDVYEGIAETRLDRIVLDLPEPWRVVRHAEEALCRGGILCAYLPSINQTAQLREALAHSAFGLEETFEVLRRTWHIEGRSVRPDQRMVAHTGFITTARLLDAAVRDRRRSEVTPDVEV
jgi:tRNA (adenine57-N1/adenine58-N1)-methyltransferase